MARDKFVIHSHRRYWNFKTVRFSMKVVAK